MISQASSYLFRRESETKRQDPQRVQQSRISHATIGDRQNECMSERSKKVWPPYDVCCARWFTFCNMDAGTSSCHMEDCEWQSVALRKCEAILYKIPENWRLNQAVVNLIRAPTDITGAIELSLDKQCREITRLHTKTILARLYQRSLTAEEVIGAFCQRTALAAQLVCNSLKVYVNSNVTSEQQCARYLHRRRTRTGE